MKSLIRSGSATAILHTFLSKELHCMYVYRLIEIKVNIEFSAGKSKPNADPDAVAMKLKKILSTFFVLST
jgi:hypothetical protein